MQFEAKQLSHHDISNICSLPVVLAKSGRIGEEDMNYDWKI